MASIASRGSALWRAFTDWAGGKPVAAALILGILPPLFGTAVAVGYWLTLRDDFFTSLSIVGGMSCFAMMVAGLFIITFDILERFRIRATWVVGGTLAAGALLATIAPHLLLPFLFALLLGQVLVLLLAASRKEWPRVMAGAILLLNFPAAYVIAELIGLIASRVEITVENRSALPLTRAVVGARGFARPIPDVPPGHRVQRTLYPWQGGPDSSITLEGDLGTSFTVSESAGYATNLMDSRMRFVIPQL